MRGSETFVPESPCMLKSGWDYGVRSDSDQFSESRQCEPIPKGKSDKIQTKFSQYLRRQSPECWQCFLQSPLLNQLSTTCFKSGCLIKKNNNKNKRIKKSTQKPGGCSLRLFFFGFFQATKESPAKIPIEFHYNYHVFLVFGNYWFSI